MKLNKEIVIYSEAMRDSIADWFRFMEVDPRDPISITFKRHKKKTRSLDQNELAFKWYREISEQGYLTPQEAHEYCKLTFGIPILIHDDEEFRVFYNSALQGLSYELQLKAMRFIPVTSLMNTVQMTQYLDAVLEHYTNEGYTLTIPIPEYAR